MITKPKVIVSYADTSLGHHGYIYQATNWIYTGLSAKRKDYKIKGLDLHSASIFDREGRNKNIYVFLVLLPCTNYLHIFLLID